MRLSEVDMTKYIMHSDKQSHSKYKGGFVKGKNTSEYNHDYYIHNKEKWKKHLGASIDAIGRTFMRLESNLYKLFSGNQNAASEPEKIGVDEISGATTGLTIKTKTPAHKYLYRVTYNGKYRYFYSETEYYSFLKNIKRKSGEYSVEDDVAAINEDYPSDGSVLNCSSCSIAYDMRRRGYDVKATSMKNGMYANEYEKMYKNGKFKTVQKKKSSSETCNSMCQTLNSYGDGARGTIRVDWKTGGGHFMCWENIGGQTYIIDAQTNSIIPAWKFTRSIAEKIDWDRNPQYMRTDDLELSDYIVDTKMFKQH